MGPDAPRTSEPSDLFDEVDRAIANLQSHADPAVREATTKVLQAIDAVHRAGLSHLVQALHALAGDTLVNRLVADPAIRMLLMSYDLIAVDRRLQAEEALDTVRGHLHDHGIDVELQDVVGGVVYARLHMTPRRGEEQLPLERVRADIEAALRECLIGFQELEFRDRSEQSAPSAVIPLESLRHAHQPVYQDALSEDELAEGTLRAAMVNKVPVLFARVGGEVYAVRNACADSPLPLDMGTLEGNEVHCPWHGCRYDVRSGRRTDADGRLQVMPVTTKAGRLLVATDVTGVSR